MSRGGAADQWLAQGRFLEAARAFEAEGRREDAAGAYSQAGQWSEAGRVLLEDRRFREAGDAWMQVLPPTPTAVSALGSEARRAAIQAALAYVRAGEVPLGVGILLNLGDRERAADLLNRNQRRDDAVRVLRGEALPDNPWAPGLLSQSPRTAPAKPREDGLDRAERLMNLGRVPEALVELQKVRPEDPRYGPAVHRAVAALSAANQLDFGLDRWLSPFLRRAHHGRADLPVLYAVGGFYDELDFVEGAEAAWRAICAVEPDYRDAGARLRELGERQRADLRAVDRIVKEDRSFLSADGPRRRGPVAGEPDPLSLPSLPAVPDSAVPPAAARGATKGLIGPLDPTRGHGARDLGFQPLGQGGASVEVGGTGLLGRARGRPVDPFAQQGGGTQAPSDPFDPFDPFGEPQGPNPTRPMGTGRPPEPMVGRLGPSRAAAPPPAQPPSRPPPSAVETAAEPRPARKSASADASGYFEGAVLSDRYLIERKLGEGGMAVVFQVRDLVLEETVALKLFRKATQDPTGAERFKQEMKICRRLNHPNIVRTFEFGVWKDAYFLTMEYLDGKDLDALIGKKQQPLAIPLAVDLLRQACDGLQAAHDEGVAHRDIKPQNMFVVGEKLKVMDFGIAKAMDAGVSQTAVGMVVGTPAYLSPERLEGRSGDGISSDLYALGVVMFQVLTGVLPFRGPDIPAMFMQHMGEKPEPPSRRNPLVPRGLERICLKLLEKKPRDRYPDARSVREELDALRATLRR